MSTEPLTREPLSLRAARLESENACQLVTLDTAVKAIHEPGKPIWIDIQVNDIEAARELLQDKMGFHELAVEDALSDRERPAVQEFGDAVFLVVPAAVDGDRYVEVGFFLSEHALVTVSRERLKVLDDWFSRWQTRPGRLAQSVSHILHAVVDGIVDGYFLVIDDVEESVEELSDNLFEGRQGRLAEIVRLKRRLMKLRRVVAPVRDVMNSLLRRDIDVLSEDSRRYFQDVLDHVLRIAETVDSLRDALTSMVDIHLSNVSNNLNEVVKKMTVLSTVLMTMALVSGVYGMNFDRIPELHWAFGYPFALALMLFLGGMVVVVFKRIRWI